MYANNWKICDEHKGVLDGPKSHIFQMHANNSLCCLIAVSYFFRISTPLIVRQIRYLKGADPLKHNPVRAIKFRALPTSSKIKFL